MQQYNLCEAKTKLLQLVQATLDGEEILIARADKMVVRLVPAVSTQPSTGSWGLLKIDPVKLDAAFLPSIESEVACLLEKVST